MQTMTPALRPRTLGLFLGDIVFFTFSLWLSLFLRTFTIPTWELFAAHLVPFSLLFVVWALVYLIAGLYESRSILLARRALSGTLLVAQIFNMSLTALFFFFVPLFGIAPKTLLLIYLPISFALVLLWRTFIFPWLGLQKTEKAILVGDGEELEALMTAMNLAHRAPVRIAERLSATTPDLARAVVGAMERHHASIVVADFDNEAVATAFPQMYNLLTVGVRFFDALSVYEEAFGRIPLSRLDTVWLARYASGYADLFYDTLKRVMDVTLAFFGGIISLVFYPFIMLAIFVEDRKAPIIALPRVGKGGREFNLLKFRSMTGNDKGSYGESGASKLRVTRVGKFLRASRLDELPQLWNVLKGDISLIGPRPETPALVQTYMEHIPYYGVRHLTKPGVSGWAQLYHHADPHHAADVKETRNKLSYDLYYLKHRSLLLDVTVALKTIRRILLRGNA
jgi:lipopolysaccharide/colanic/teichoic acid biosynthesis glycosyltransferase